MPATPAFRPWATFVEYSELVQALRASVQDLLTEEEADARCVVHAEGAAADAEEKRYAQDALVASVRFAGAAANTAFERFTREGPLALLPLAGGYAVVWSLRPERARSLASAPEKEFLEAARARRRHAARGSRFRCEARAVQPLVLTGRQAQHRGKRRSTSATPPRRCIRSPARD